MLISRLCYARQCLVYWRLIENLTNMENYVDIFFLLCLIRSFVHSFTNQAIAIESVVSVECTRIFVSASKEGTFHSFHIYTMVQNYKQTKIQRLRKRQFVTKNCSDATLSVWCIYCRKNSSVIYRSCDFKIDKYQVIGTTWKRSCA